MQNSLMMDALPNIASKEDVTLWKRFKRYLADNQETFALMLFSTCVNYNAYSSKILDR